MRVLFLATVELSDVEPPATMSEAAWLKCLATTIEESILGMIRADVTVTAHKEVVQ